MADKNEKPKSEAAEKEDKKLDKALEDSFPASDPPSITDPNRHIGSAKEKPATSSRP
jgi:hypothetical protein